MICGIDIGSTGAVALLDDHGELLDVRDMPCLNDGPAGRRAVNPRLLADVFLDFSVRDPLHWKGRTAFVEHVATRPGEGVVSAFAFGRSRGVVEGVLGTLLIPYTLITPKVWKGIIGIPPGKEGAKEAARSLAIRRWPDKAQLFRRVLDHNRAEAALIGFAGLRMTERAKEPA